MVKNKNKLYKQTQRWTVFKLYEFLKVILINIGNLVENVDKISKEMENLSSTIKNIKVNQLKC